MLKLDLEYQAQKSVLKNRSKIFEFKNSTELNFHLFGAEDGLVFQVDL